MGPCALRPRLAQLCWTDLRLCLGAASALRSALTGLHTLHLILLLLPVCSSSTGAFSLYNLEPAHTRGTGCRLWASGTFPAPPRRVRGSRLAPLPPPAPTRGTMLAAPCGDARTPLLPAGISVKQPKGRSRARLRKPGWRAVSVPWGL